MNYAWLSQAPRSALLIGDSLAVGLGPPLATELQRSGIAMTTRAEISTSAQTWRQRAPALFGQLKPEVVLVSLGSNDAQSSTLTTSFGDNMRAICDSASSNGARRCAWLSPPNRTAAQVSAPAVERIAPPAVELQSDGIHPTATGYRAWASSVAPQLSAPPAQPSAPHLSPPSSSLVPWLAAAAAVAVGFWALFRGKMMEA